MLKIIRRKLDVLDFGKHKGKTVRWVIENDPSYIIWLHENKVCEVSEEIVEEAVDKGLEDFLGSTFDPNYSYYEE